MHGGKSPVGIAHPNFKDGSQSAYFPKLPGRMQADFQGALQQDDYLNLREEKAIVKARAMDLLGRVDSGESGESWRTLRSTYAEAEKQRRRWDAGRETVDGQKARADFFEAFETIGSLIAEGTQDYAAWDEWGKQSESMRRIAETEVKRIKAAQNALTEEQAKMFVYAVQQSVLKHVKDRTILAAIAADIASFAAFSGHGNGVQPRDVGEVEPAARSGAALD